FNVLLQIMDYGKLTDHNGKNVDFRNVILIMTTNAGAADMAKPAMGFERETRVGEDEEAINRMFTPEFRNRLDAMIGFNALSPKIMTRIVDKFVMELETQLADRNVVIELTDAAREWLAKQGYEPAFGARPLARVIQERVKKPLAEELLFGKLAKGGVVRVDIEDKIPVFVYEAAEGARKGRGKGGSKGGPKDDKGGKPSKDKAELVE
ncbi:MAG: AAA family ATPase, partial [Alphaproteobacteria bacterium]